MKKLKSLSTHLSILLSSVLLITSCSQYNTFDDSSPEANNVVASIGDEDFYRSIVFLDGPLTDQLGELALYSPEGLQMDESAQRAYSEFQTEFIISMKADNPGYFESFRKDILSKEYGTISKSLKTTVSDMHEFAQKRFENFEGKKSLYSIERLVEEYDVEEFEVAAEEECIDIIIVILLALAYTITYTINVNYNYNYTYNQTKGNQKIGTIAISDRIMELKNSHSISKDEFILTLVNNL